MPILHQPAGSPKGGQFAPGQGSNQAPTLSGTPKQQRAESRYYRALARQKKHNDANVKRYLTALSRAKHKKDAAAKKAAKAKASAAKKAATASTRAKKLAAAKQVARAHYLAQKPIIAKPGHYKPFTPGKKP